jgi:hypothetical protein
MNIVSAGNRYMIYGEEVKTYKILPAKTYKVCFSKMSGFYLTEHNELMVNEKVYGDHPKKVDKVINTFENLNRNMGVILSGEKGVGKSMFARLLAQKANAKNLPLLIVDYAYPAIEDFLSSITQECVILFDEFEKIFKQDKDNNYDPQENLLSLFDGIDNGKKLYVITCNETRKLNSYLLNRPGRFHYHFVIEAPTNDEIKEYLMDNLNDDAIHWVDKVISLNGVVNYTYDILRAIVFELNNGYDLSETLNDLNIERNRFMYFDVFVQFTNGCTARSVSGIEFDLIHANEYYGSCTFTSEIPELVKVHANKIIFEVPASALKASGASYEVDINQIDVHLSDNYKYIGLSDENEQFITDFGNNLEVSGFYLKKPQSPYGTTAFENRFCI